MALRTGPIPRVAVGEIIEEDWGDSVAQSLNNIYEQVDWVAWQPPSGATFDADKDGLMTQWFVIGGASPISIAVPDWATNAYADFQITGVQYNPTTAGRTSYLLQARFGTIAGRLFRFTGQPGWFGLSWADAFPNVEDIAGGDRTVKIFAQRIENTGGASDRWRLFDQSDVSMRIIFTQAVQSYPGL